MMSWCSRFDIGAYYSLFKRIIPVSTAGTICMRNCHHMVHTLTGSFGFRGIVVLEERQEDINSEGGGKGGFGLWSLVTVFI